MTTMKRPIERKIRIPLLILIHLLLLQVQLTVHGFVAPSLRAKSPLLSSQRFSAQQPENEVKAKKEVQEEDPEFLATMEKLKAKAEKRKRKAIEERKFAKLRNMAIAVSSITFAIGNYIFQYTRPIPVQLAQNQQQEQQQQQETITELPYASKQQQQMPGNYLTPLQQLALLSERSDPISIIGTNGKPTVVDFWAPWCENCKLSAPTMADLEAQYKDKVNFVMINCDGEDTSADSSARSWKYIRAFGVDAIPHVALVSAEGDVETALIGPIPKSVLQADFDTLLENADHTKKQETKKDLPYVMFDAFVNYPDRRRVHFDSF